MKSIVYVKQVCAERWVVGASKWRAVSEAGHKWCVKAVVTIACYYLDKDELEVGLYLQAAF